MTTPAQQASAFAVHFEAKNDGVRQSQSGDWRLTLTLAGDGLLPEKIMLAKPGTRYMVALVEIGDDEQPVPTTTPDPVPAADPVAEETPAERAHRKWKDIPLPNQAGMRCAEADFQAFLGVSSAEEAAKQIKFLCGIDSRKDLAVNQAAAEKWAGIDYDYRRWFYERSLNYLPEDGQ